MIRSTRVLIGFALVTASVFAIEAAAAVPGGDEQAIRDNYKELQAAIKSKDSAKIWSLSSGKAKAEMEKLAKEAAAEHAKLDPAGKAKQAKQTGIPAATLAKMTGQDYFQSATFTENYSEIDDSKIDKVVITGDKSVVHYTEEDGHKRTLDYVKQDNKWAADFAITKLR